MLRYHSNDRALLMVEPILLDKKKYFLTLQIDFDPHFNIVGFAVQVKSYDVSWTELKSVSNFVTKYQRMIGTTSVCR